jgi:hypothetical protein
MRRTVCAVAALPFLLLVPPLRAWDWAAWDGAAWDGANCGGWHRRGEDSRYCEARTMNGGLDVELAGTSWEGTRLDVETRNGGVDLSIPDGYSAELEVGTVNGRLEVDFPVTIQGRLDRHLRTTLGGGGEPVRVVTTNGGVTVRRR